MGGAFMIVMATAFFAGMALMAGRSTDPVALMQTVGSVSGMVGALGAFLAVLGIIGRRIA
jgi:hypothetical protein